MLGVSLYTFSNFMKMKSVINATRSAVLSLVSATILICLFMYLVTVWYSSNRMLTPRHSLTKGVVNKGTPQRINLKGFNILGPISQSAQEGMTYKQMDLDFSARLMFSSAMTKFWKPPQEVLTELQMDPSFFNRTRTEFRVPPNHLSTDPQTDFDLIRTMLIAIPDGPDWLKPHTNNHTMKYCTYSNCLVSYDRSGIPKADAVAFWHCRLPSVPPPRRKGQPWVIFSGESSVHITKQFQKPEWRGKFNWTMTYSRASDLFTPCGMFAPAKDPRSYQQLLDITQKKTKTAAWFVSHCPTQSRREEYVKRLQKIIDVDIFGKCGTKRCSRSDPRYIQMLGDTYKFYLSFENSFCEDYITEKLYNIFDVPCVPVVRGGADYKSLVPRGTYINAADFSTPEELGRYLKQLSNDTSAYMDILMRKEQFRTFKPKVGKHLGFCELCYRLNNPGFHRNDHHDDEVLLTSRKCFRPLDLGHS